MCGPTAAEYDAKAKLSVGRRDRRQVTSGGNSLPVTSAHSSLRSSRWNIVLIFAAVAIMILNLLVIMQAHRKAFGFLDMADQATQAIDQEMKSSPALRKPQHRKLKETQEQFAFNFVTRNSTVKQDPGKSFMILTGLIGDMSEIQIETLHQLVQLNCENSVAVHILAMKITNKTTTIREQRGNYDTCAPFIALKQNDNVKTLFPNRIDRIAYLRDVQRDALRRQFVDESAERVDLKRSAVIVMDLDLYQIPSNEEIIREAHLMMKDQEGADVVCAAGIMFRPFGYYDVFATVLAPSTFAYPLNGRLFEEYREQDDPELVRSNNVYGAFTQIELQGYLEEKAVENSKHYVPVRSCFGGMAVYRASTWFLLGCRYNSDTSELMEFANAADGRPCEHVVFHECLNKQDLSTIIAIKPNLQPLREEPLPERSELFSGEKPVDDRIVTFSEFPDKATTLVNGDYTLAIDGKGMLAVTKKNSQKALWKAQIDPRLFHESWDVMFMMVQSDGQLVLQQQVWDEDLRSDVEGYCDYYDDNDDRVCRLVVWRSGYRVSSPGHFTLQLTDSGDLVQYDSVSGQAVWSSKEGRNPTPKRMVDAETTISSTKNEGNNCIQSGDEKDINQALDRPGVKVVLCPGTIFRIHSPIKFSGENQTLLTQEKGTGADLKKATIIVDDPAVASAVSMTGVSYAMLKNVIIDGNRRQHGAVPLEKYAGGLIDAGGDSAHGQHIVGVDAFDARSWVILRVTPGGPGARCKEITVEFNYFGQAGSEGHPADGISYACKDGVIRGNVIEDVADVGISLVGAPKTIVKGNTIRASSMQMHTGITMCSLVPFGGNYTDTVVKDNVIDARGAKIDIGLAMGSRILGCYSSETEQKPVFGASVTKNTLSGDSMGYGYAINGVRNWQALANKDFSRHIGESVLDCNGQRPSTPNGFQIDRSASEGVFQSEFTDASLNGIAVTTKHIGTQAPKGTVEKLQFTKVAFSPSNSTLVQEQTL